MAIPVARKEDGPKTFKNGYGEVEWLKGTHKLVHCFKCELKAGSTVLPGLYKDKNTMFCFVKGTGYITTKEEAFNIKELSFFVPDFDNDKFSIHAVTDLEIMKFVVDLTESDIARYNSTHAVLPFFKTLSAADRYTQDCKGPHTTSWSILHPGSITRILCGVVLGYGPGEGTVEKGHPSVDQWNYILDGSDITMTVENETYNHHEGELSYIYAGPDHSLVPSGEGKKAYYIWFEHQTAEYPIKK
ncbi:MAG: hypothetical protein WC102_00575 [Saccharofermentanales bacterium]